MWCDRRTGCKDTGQAAAAAVGEDLKNTPVGAIKPAENEDRVTFRQPQKPVSILGVHFNGTQLVCVLSLIRSTFPIKERRVDDTNRPALNRTMTLLLFCGILCCGKSVKRIVAQPVTGSDVCIFARNIYIPSLCID